MTLSEIASLLSCVFDRDAKFSGISIDSRNILPQQLFIAIRGDNFDGHDFILDVERKGAAAVVCERAVEGCNILQLIVPNSIDALAKIASHYRQKLSCPVIAVTGSNGKTSVKEMISNILPPPSFATPGNLNNHIGVPLSIFQLNSMHKYAVFEAGASRQGDIAHTVAIIKPNVTLINNIAPAHIEGFGSIEGVAKAKGEIHQGLMPGGTAIINDDDAYFHYWDDILSGKKIVRFSLQKPATIHATDIEMTENGCAKFVLVTPLGSSLIQLNVPGIHNVSNALAAASCTYALGIELSDIVSGLQSFFGVAGRMTFIVGKNNSIIIDDTYNANLRSSLTALDVLSKCQGKRILVFGDMGELGDWTELHHHEVGVVARENRIDHVMTFGKHSIHTSRAFAGHGKHYESKDLLVNDLISHLNDQTTVLVKGSRLSAMETIVKKLGV